MKRSMPKGVKIAKTAGIILYIAVFAVLTVAMTLVYCWPAASNFVTQNILNQKTEAVEPGTVTYFKPAFATMDEAYAHSQEVAILAQAEGTVQLENNGALPLAATERRISVFGTGSVNIAYGGTGSGEGNRSGRTDLYTALEGEGFTVNPTLKSFYEQKYQEGYLQRITKRPRGRVHRGIRACGRRTVQHERHRL